MTTTHPDAAAFLAAIRANPDCDTTRLVYADWLDENGREREGELLRVQCRKLSLEEYTDVGAAEVEEWHKLKARERELIAELAPRCPACDPAYSNGLRQAGLLPPCPHCSGKGYCPCTFERGFLTEVRVPGIASVLAQCDKCEEGFVWEDYQIAHNAPRRRQVHCENCKGALWQPTDYGRALVAEHPLLARVVPVDREPWAATDIGAFGWWERWTGETDHAAIVQGPVFERMWADHPAARHEDAIGRWLVWDTPNPATAALGTALCKILSETAR